MLLVYKTLTHHIPLMKNFVASILILLKSLSTRFEMMALGVHTIITTFNLMRFLGSESFYSWVI
jgi:hypothetical protein